MEQQEKKGVMVSGIQPTGIFTLGNYLGAVRNWDMMQNEYSCYYFLADLHSLTVKMEPKALRRQSYEAYALLLACGIDPGRSVVFAQSHVYTHSELNWILNCYAQFGELSRMTQFKDKSKAHTDNINSGLFTYPVLMAGDILLYKADFVPVGVDQKQHLEFTRDLAGRFNGLYGDTFKIPEPYIADEGAKVMSLQEPTKKMSKSDANPNAFISILDEPNVILNKFKRAVTDSECEVCCREGKDGINNLMEIYSVITGMTYEEIQNEFAGKGYGDFKVAVGELVSDMLRPIRDDFKRYINDKAYLEAEMRRGAEQALRVSSKTLSKVKKRVGLLPEIVR